MSGLSERELNEILELMEKADKEDLRTKRSRERRRAEQESASTARNLLIRNLRGLPPLPKKRKSRCECKKEQTGAEMSRLLNRLQLVDSDVNRLTRQLRGTRLLPKTPSVLSQIKKSMPKKKFRIKSKRQSRKRVKSKRQSKKRVSRKRVKSKRQSKKRVSRKRVKSKRQSRKRVSRKRVKSKRQSRKRQSRKRVKSKRQSRKRVKSKRQSRKRVKSKRQSRKRVKSKRQSRKRVSRKRVKSKRQSRRTVTYRHDNFPQTAVPYPSFPIRKQQGGGGPSPWDIVLQQLEQKTVVPYDGPFVLTPYHYVIQTPHFVQFRIHDRIGITAAELRRLLTVLPHNNIESLNLNSWSHSGGGVGGGKQIGSDGAAILAEYLRDELSDIVDLSLTHNNIGDVGATHLATALRDNPPLLALNLSYNNIEDEGAIHLAEALTVNSTLTALNLGYNRIGNEGVLRLNRALRDNEELVALNLYGDRDHIDEEGLRTTPLDTRLKLGRPPLFLTGNAPPDYYKRAVDQVWNEWLETKPEQDVKAAMES